MNAFTSSDAAAVAQAIDEVLERLLDGSIEQSEAREHLLRLVALVASGTPYIAQVAASEIAALQDEKKHQP